MRLSILLPIELPENLDVDVTHITLDSRCVKPGSLFIAFPGGRLDGRDFIAQAIIEGAIAILAEGDEDKIEIHSNTVPIVYRQNVAAQCSAIAARFYDYPSQKMQVIGVTGTNGKTSVCYFIAAAVSLLGNKGAYLGTLGCAVYGEVATQTGLTTADAITVQRLLAQLSERGVDVVAMEVSSHALDQHRVNAVQFQQVIFTNLTQDHLDYHQTMEQYWNCKKRLFTDFKWQHALINIDDEYGQRILQEYPNMLSYGFSVNAQIQATTILYSAAGTKAQLQTPWQNEVTLYTQLLGAFNLHNILAVLGALIGLGYELNNIIPILKQLPTVPGRLQTVRAPARALAVIDYAHTPDALQKVLSVLHEQTQGQLWCVFGCGGDRDAGKRPLMGRIAEQWADHVIITNDNPRSEDPDAIIEQILAGMKTREYVIIEPCRRSAILLALEQAGENDTVLIAGKGHETTQIIGTRQEYFSDEAIVQEHYL